MTGVLVCSEISECVGKMKSQQYWILLPVIFCLVTGDEAVFETNVEDIEFQLALYEACLGLRPCWSLFYGEQE